MHELDDDVHPYGGEKLVSDGSFLRRMPQVVPIKERMRLDAIVTAADIIEQSFNVLRTVTAEISTEIEKFGNIERAYIISQCWTLVDQLHAIRQLLETAHKKEPRPFTKHFLGRLSPSHTELRLLRLPASVTSRLGGANGVQSTNRNAGCRYPVCKQWFSDAHTLRGGHPRDGHHQQCRQNDFGREPRRRHDWRTDERTGCIACRSAGHVEELASVFNSEFTGSKPRAGCSDERTQCNRVSLKLLKAEAARLFAARLFRPLVALRGMGVGQAALMEVAA